MKKKPYLFYYDKPISMKVFKTVFSHHKHLKF